MPFHRRSYFFIPMLLAACALAWWTLGSGGALAAPADDPLGQSLKSFTQIFDVVEQNFADPVKAEKAVYSGAIPGMLRTLDPHSHFFDPTANDETRENQSGRYYGVGMTMNLRNGKPTVVAPFGGSPAFRAGVRPGDIILEAAGRSTTGMSDSDVAQLLRGPRGTPVQLVLTREGVEQPISVRLVRDEIPRPTVPLAFFVKPGIAYVQVTSFGENTGKEMEERFKKLGEKDVTGLVLDLRDNPGGLVNECIDVASHFLQRGQLVVSHRGLHSANKNYSVRADGSGKNYPIVVLVNANSASAAEIVSGALQDHDRGWVVGQPTFGKGLVQTDFQLSNNTALWLTTARYYTPSGRLIQRDYSGITVLDYLSRARTEEKNLNDVKMTDSGRTVYGGGGITPDEKYEPPAPNRFQIESRLRTFAFFNFSAHYFGPRDAKLPKDWEPTEALVNEFHDYIRQHGVEFTETEFRENRDWVKHELKREMFIAAFSLEDSQRVAAEHDPAVLKAIDSLPKAVSLLAAGRKLALERKTRQPRFDR